MTTGAARPLPDNARLRRSAVGALFAGIFLMIAPIVASIRAAPLLTEAAHWIVFSYGAILIIYGVSTLTDLRAKWNKPQQHPAGSGTDATSSVLLDDDKRSRPAHVRS